MKLQVPSLFSQRDPKWASLILGNNDPKSSYTIGLYGCLITTLGMYIGQTPDQVNNTLKANGGFSQNSGDFVWSKSSILGINQTYISPRYEDAVTYQGIQKMKDSLDAGFPLVCEIDFNPNTQGEEMHFVLIYGYDGDEFYIYDPWTGTATTLDIYGGAARAVIQFRTYDKKLLAGATTVQVDSVTFENLVRKSTICDEVREKLQVADSEAIILAEVDKLIQYEDAVMQKDKQLDDANKKIGDLQQQITDLNKQQDQLTKDNKGLSDQIGQQKETIDKQKDNIDMVSKQLEDLKKTCNQPALSGWKKSLYDFLSKF